ncbi:uncharacterized protein LOC111089316 [Limulus polyphemus]|uniref:Uncharacterized protein LOC111089316 n=1 Tax=Limulus polyphemus TaxID=6850 RepID=A0ABM1TN38_LIMPO|nr:uncharacterized protein LOC111089316 [Limulus polyphemus]
MATAKREREKRLLTQSRVPYTNIITGFSRFFHRNFIPVFCEQENKIYYFFVNKVIDSRFTNSHFRRIDNTVEARDFLDVSGEISLNVKNGKLDISGAGKYLQDKSLKENVVEVLVKVTHETFMETIPSEVNPAPRWQEKDMDGRITHYVRSITYGGEMIITIRFVAKSSRYLDEIKAKVSVAISIGDVKGSFEKLSDDLKEECFIEIDTSATIPVTSPITTIKEAMEMVKQYPEDVKKVNNGWGNPLRVELFPVAALENTNKESYRKNMAFNALLDELETKFDDIRVTNSEFQKFLSTDLELSDEQWEEVSELYEDVTAAREAIINAIEDMDVSNKGNLSQFDDAFKTYGTGEDNLPHKYIRKFSSLKNKLDRKPSQSELKHGDGATYVHWGNTSCGVSSSVFLYSGYGAGPLPFISGGGVNFQCVPEKQGSISKERVNQDDPFLLTRLSYQLQDEHQYTLTCAVCYKQQTLQAYTFPAMKECPQDWKLEYKGILVTPKAPFFRTDSICLAVGNESETYQSSEDKATVVLVPVGAKPNGSLRVQRVPCVVCSL